MREIISKIEREKSVSSTERAAFEEDLIKEKSAYGRLENDFRQYKMKVENEIEVLEGHINKLQKEVNEKDIEITELENKLEDAKADGIRYKENYCLNSYLKNLPRTGLWLSNRELQKGANEATRTAVETMAKEKARSTIRRFEEEVETDHANNKKTVKKQYIGRANEMIEKNDEEMEDQLNEMEKRFSSNLDLGKGVESYLTEFK